MTGPEGEGETIASSRPADEGRRTLDELQRRNQELSAAIAARDAFLAMAAHELRNPMTPIVGQVQRLRRLVEARTCSLEDVEQGLRRIEWLVDHYVKRATTLLDVSRITSGKLRLQPESVDVAALMRDLVAAIEPAAQYSGSTVNLQLHGDFVVTIDRLAVEQVIDNLLLNAIKYGAGRPVDIAVAGEDAFFRIEVRDRGIGMSPQDQQRIFEPFERAVAHGSATGFGVGLWVVCQLVDAMGGEIKVESAPNVGTTFTVTLPRPRES